MKKWMSLLLIFGVLLLMLAGCMSVGETNEAPNAPANEEPAEEEPGDILEPTEAILPTQTASLPDTGGVPATPAPTEEVQTIVIDLNTVYAEVVAGLPQGSALFNPPGMMRLGEEYLVEVRVVPVTGEELEEAEEIIATLTVGMEDDRPVVVIPLKLSTVMSARLTGGSFSIKPLNQEEQIRTSDQPYLSWQWEVRPEKAGEQRLTLHLSVVVNAEGMGDKTYTTSEIREVAVSGNLLYIISRFMGSNWEWVVTGLLLPFLGWGGRRVWGRIRGGS